MREINPNFRVVTLWKASTLSIGGRVTLIKAVFESLPVYFFSLYKAPVCVIQKLDSLRRNFLWGGNKDNRGINWVSWDVVTTPKSSGGLGLTPLQDFNKSLLAKWHWRYRIEYDRLWRKTVDAFHDTQYSVKSLPCKLAASGTWKMICSAGVYFAEKGIDFEDQFKGVIGCGEHLRFWLDNWSGRGKFGSLFPELFKMESSKKVNVANRVQSNGNFKWNWKEKSWSQEAIKELLEFLNLEIQAHFTNAQDKWEWGTKGSKIFSVSAARRLLTSGNLDANSVIFPWNKTLPSKVNIFGWRLLRYRLPSKEALTRRGIRLENSNCVLCGEQEETLEHLITGCKLANDLWEAIGEWCKMSPMLIFSIKDLIFLHEHIKGSKLRKSCIQAVILVACWVIWKSRNEVNFRGSKINAIRMLQEVKSMGFLGIKSRLSKGCLEEQQWLEFSIT